jgi:flagellar hook-associated protein 3 FlgL
MADRIASYASTSSLMAQALRLQSTYAKTNAQQSSGLKSEHYEGISGEAKKLINLQTQFDSISAYSSVISSATSTMNSMQGALDNVSKMFTTILGQLTQLQGGTAGGTSGPLTAAQVNSWRDELASLLNIKQGGQYVFGGSVTGTAPVDLADIDYDPTADGTVPDTGYYQGDSELASVRANDHLRVSYGISADNPAFEKAFRALSLLAANPTDTATITQAHALMKEASAGAADLSGVLASKTAVLEQEANLHVATLDYLDTRITELREVDITQTAVQLAQLEAQLEASYSTLTTLMNLKLTDYLR